MKTKIFVVLAVAALALLIPGRAQAVVCPDTVVLDNTNVTGFDVTVTLCVNGDTVTLESITNNAGLSVVGLDKLGIPEDVGIVSDTDPTGTWAAKNNNPNNMDGFGQFFEFDQSASTCGATGNLNCSWTFDDPPGTSEDTWAVHVRFSNGCSAFVSNGETDSAGPDTNCTGVPEPGTLSLLASGLLGIGGLFFVRRRLPMPTASA